MIRLILRIAAAAVVLLSLGAIGYSGYVVEQHIVALGQQEAEEELPDLDIFDPFAEPESQEPPPVERVWLEVVDYDRGFFSSTAQVDILLRVTADSEPTRTQAKLHLQHGPLHFRGGFALAAARLQVSFDSQQTSWQEPIWCSDEQRSGDKILSCGLLGYDGSYAGQIFLQHTETHFLSFAALVESVIFSIEATPGLEEVFVDAEVALLNLDVGSTRLHLPQGVLTLRAKNLFDAERFGGVVSSTWAGVTLNDGIVGSQTDAFVFNAEYRFIEGILSVEVDVGAEGIGGEAGAAADAPVILDYAETVLAVNGVPIEDLLEIWDRLDVNAPPADFTYQIDHRFMEFPRISDAVTIAKEYELVEEDPYGFSGYVHIRAGEVRVNGEEVTIEELLGSMVDQPLWPAK